MKICIIWGITSSVEPNKVVVSGENDKPGIVRRYKVINGQGMLLADDPSVDPIIMDKNWLIIAVALRVTRNII